MTDTKNNTGHRNTGDWNTGHRNTGDWNTGHRNTGHRNTGDWNTGHRNTGHRNTGHRNTGHRNTGHRNTGDWNTGHRNTGYCNTATPDDCLIFNKPAKRSDWENATKPSWMYFNLTTWIEEKDMTDKEKEAYPSYTATGGYLKVCTSYQHAAIESWEKATPEDRALTFKLPNFDKKVFMDIFGFDPEKDEKTVSVDGAEYKTSHEKLARIKAILEE